MGILRADRITGLGGANAITGSTSFGGSGNHLKVEGIDDDFVTWWTADFTIEAWVFIDNFASWMYDDGYHFPAMVGHMNPTDSSNYWSFGPAENNSNNTLEFYYWKGSQNHTFVHTATIKENEWTHIAMSFSTSNGAKLFINGTGTSYISLSGTPQVSSSAVQFVVGQYNNQNISGNISNLRILKGTALYTSDFTPPTNRLEKTSDTKLLICNSASDVTHNDDEKIITSVRSSTNNSGPVASKFTPNSPVGFSTTSDVGSQYGSTFNGFGNFATSTYMVPPGGNTKERNRGRGLIGQGSNTTSPYNVKAISYIEIQSGGTAFDFGDSTNGSMYAMTAVSSSTRAVFAGGHTSQVSPYGNTNLMEFVTISTTANCIDFGDLNVAAANRVGASNQTRGLIAAGFSPSTRNIDKIEIATAGDAIDYGDLDNQGFYGLNSGGMVSSTTRGLYAGGSGNSAPVAVNTITFSLFSTAGNSTDFGDLTHTNGYFNVGNSNGTRGIFMGGSDIDSPYPATDQIDYVTIASAGNAIDFGSLNTSRYNAMGASNSTRGVLAGGRINPAPTAAATNHMEYVTISTTGNGLDFGELIEPEKAGAGCSDSHGGL